jgi:hypothetical protein
MTKLSPRYCAGFFDGEGCINITCGGRNHQTALRVMVVNTDEAILKMFLDSFGGGIYKRSRGHKTHWKPFIVWKATGHKAAAFLSYIQDYVIVKERQLDLALEFWDFQHSENRCELRNSPTKTMPNRVVAFRKSETIARELEFKAKMHELNKKGMVI